MEEEKIDYETAEKCAIKLLNFIEEDIEYLSLEDLVDKRRSVMLYLALKEWL